MNYKRIYDNLIERAKTRTIDGYTEKHHIIPRCMNGSDDDRNLVRLTPEEHYIAHLLLVKIYPDNSKLVYAANMMCVSSDSHNGERQSNKRHGWLRRKWQRHIVKESAIEWRTILNIELRFRDGLEKWVKL